jgi:phosphate starvation-inducible PhoH-like protein
MARTEPAIARAVLEGNVSADVEVTDPTVLLRLTGPSNQYLKIIEREVRAVMGLRGNTIRIQGTAQAVSLAERVLAELIDILGETNLSEADITRSVRTLRAHPDMRLRDLRDDSVFTTTSRRIVAPKSVTQQAYVQAIRQFDVVFGLGPAGTGKTYLAMAMAVRALVERRVKRIVLTRPAVEAGERLGFLPGDLAEKINPYLRPLHDALHDMIEPDRVTQLTSQGAIEVAPLAFMRGRTLNDAFVVLDEAQNTTVEQMKMFLTRLGFGSQAVITGDLTQVDLPRGAPSGLLDAERLLHDVDGVRFIRFTDVDIVRHPLVQRIVKAYDQRDADRMAARYSPDRRYDDNGLPLSTTAEPVRETRVGPGPATGAENEDERG